MDTNAVVQHIINWLKNYANKANIGGFVVGVSGGIDSAVTSTLCAKTGLKVLCLEMPIHQADSHVNRVQEHIRFLEKNYSNVSSKRVNLTPVFESLKSEIDTTKDQKIVDMALANTRARPSDNMRSLKSIFSVLILGLLSLNLFNPQCDWRTDNGIV